MKRFVKGLLAAGAAATVLAIAGCHCCDQPAALDKFGNPIYTGHHCNWFHHDAGYDAVAVAPAPEGRPMMMKAKRKKKHMEMEQS